MDSIERHFGFLMMGRHLFFSFEEVSVFWIEWAIMSHRSFGEATFDFSVQIFLHEMFYMLQRQSQTLTVS